MPDTEVTIKPTEVDLERLQALVGGRAAKADPEFRARFSQVVQVVHPNGALSEYSVEEARALHEVLGQVLAKLDSPEAPAEPVELHLGDRVRLVGPPTFSDREPEYRAGQIVEIDLPDETATYWVDIDGQSGPLWFPPSSVVPE